MSTQTHDQKIAQNQGWITPEDVDQWDAEFDITNHVINAATVAREAVQKYYADEMIGQRPSRAKFERHVCRLYRQVMKDQREGL